MQYIKDYPKVARGSGLAGGTEAVRGHVPRFLDSGVFVSPVGGPSRSLLEVRGTSWVALPVQTFPTKNRQLTLFAFNPPEWGVGG